jgi:uncharacterized protein YrrD
MKAVTKFVGFQVILIETKYSDKNVDNVSFNQTTKKFIKQKKGKPTDVENCLGGEESYISRKVWFPCLNIRDFQELMNDACLTYDGETLGALTENGWLNAKSYTYSDGYSNTMTDAYISIIFEFEGFENVKENSAINLKNLAFQQRISELLYDLIDQDLRVAYNHMQDHFEMGEYTLVQDTDQLELNLLNV